MRAVPYGGVNRCRTEPVRRGDGLQLRGAYIVAAVILLGYTGSLLRRARRALRRIQS